MIQYIQYKTKKYPVRVSYLAIKKLKSNTGKSFSEIKDDDFEVYEKLLYYALVSGAKAADEELKLQESEMEDVLDECFMDFVALIPLFFPAKTDPTTGKEMSVEKK